MDQHEHYDGGVFDLAQCLGRVVFQLMDIYRVHNNLLPTIILG